MSDRFNGKLRNVLGQEINPATTEGQDAIVTAIGSIVIPAPVGGATEGERKEADGMRKRLAELEQKQNNLIEKNLSGVISDSILKQQLSYIEKEITELQASLLNAQENEQNPVELLEFAENYLKYPSIFWENAKLHTKLKLQWFEFPSGIIFENEKFRTAQIASIYNVKTASCDAVSTMVDFDIIFLNQVRRELEYLCWVLKENESYQQENV